MKLLDACVWIDFLNGAKVPELETEIVEGGVAVCGTVVAEVLSGLRDDARRALLAERLRSLPYLAETRATFEAAASACAGLRKQGLTLPLADCILASLAREHDVTFVTYDDHFQAFGEPARFVVLSRAPATAPT